MALQTAYRAQFGYGRRSLKYPLPALATNREIRKLEPRSVFIHANFSMDADYGRFNRLDCAIDTHCLRREIRVSPGNSSVMRPKM